VDEVRAECEAKASSQKYFAKLEECNNRVNSRSHTEETCHEEMLDWVHSVDHCVSNKKYKVEKNLLTCANYSG
jgi:ubiquinol-cytochrome c reductase subunit 6